MITITDSQNQRVEMFTIKTAGKYTGLVFVATGKENRVLSRKGEHFTKDRVTSPMINANILVLLTKTSCFGFCVSHCRALQISDPGTFAVYKGSFATRISYMNR